MPNGGGYRDDENIANDVRLFRRLPLEWVIRDENLNCHRPSSQAFNNSQDGSPMSVFREDVLNSEGRTPSSVLAGTYSNYGLASLTAEVVRREGQGIAPDPLPDETSHALVFGSKPPKLRKRLAKAAELVIMPQQMQPETQA